MKNEVIGPAIRHGIEQGIPRRRRSILSRQLTIKFGPLPDHAVTLWTRAMEDALDCAAIARMMASRLYRFYPVACAGTSDVAADEISPQLGRGRIGTPW